MTKMNWNLKLNSAIKSGALIGLTALVSVACTKGGTISGSTVSSVSGSITVQKVFPTAAGESWTPITGTILAGSGFYVKGLSVSVTGTCTRGIDKIKVYQDSAPATIFTEQATCLNDGSWSWSRSFPADEGDKILTFTAYDINDAALSGPGTPVHVRVDATAPSVGALADVQIAAPAATPYSHSGSTAYYDIQISFDPNEVSKIRDPSGTLNAVSVSPFTYRANLVRGSNPAFTFYAYDLADNESVSMPQTITWDALADMIAFRATPGSIATNSGKTLESSMEPITGKATVTAGSRTYDLFKGFNYIVNKARGL